MNIVDFKKVKRKKISDNLPKAYLEAEALIEQIKAEYFRGVKKISKDKDWETYEALMYKFGELKDRLTENLWNELHERLHMSLCAIDCVFEDDKESREDARKDFQIKFEIISLLQFENFEFKKKYEEEVKKEWLEE
jgi:hypothetical protein